MSDRRDGVACLCNASHTRLRTAPPPMHHDRSSDSWTADILPKVLASRYGAIWRVDLFERRVQHAFSHGRPRTVTHLSPNQTFSERSGSAVSRENLLHAVLRLRASCPPRSKAAHPPGTLFNPPL